MLGLLFFDSDGTVKGAFYPNPYKYTPENCKIPDHYQGLKYIIFDDSSLPNHEDTPQLYTDDLEKVSSIADIKKDENWSRQVMSPRMIKKKQINYLHSQMDLELSKESPDVIRVVKMQRELDVSKQMKEPNYWYRKALDSLHRAEIDKPLIKQKLEYKIEQLKQELIDAPIQRTDKTDSI